MDDFKESVMIALLPTNTSWCKIALPHLTLVYAGEKDGLKPTAFNDMAKEAAGISMLSGPIMLKVVNTEVFGNWSDNPSDRVDVFRLQASPELMAMRRMVEHWNASEHEFNPHVTIGPMGSASGVEMPMYLSFDRIMVAWGRNEDITFWLRR